MKNTRPDWLVPTKMALKLKEMGFDEPCLIAYYNYVYSDEKQSSFISFNKDSCSDVNIDILECKFNRNSDFKYQCKIYPVNITTIPTWEQVFKWFRDKGYHSSLHTYSVILNNNKEQFRFFYEINSCHSYFADNENYYKTYEKCREALVNKLIEIYKENI